MRTTPAGALKISVTHIKPELAADYANKLMENIKTLVESEKTLATDQRQHTAQRHG